MEQYSYQSGASSQFMVQELPADPEEVLEQRGGAGKPTRFRNLVPVEVRRLLQHREEQGPLHIQGLEVGLVGLVGQVRGVEVKETSSVYQVEDHTGRIEVVLWHQEEEQPPPALEGSLVRVVGQVRSGREQSWVTAYRVAPVLSRAEVDSHLLEVVLLPLRLARMHQKTVDLAQASFTGQSLLGLRHLASPAPRQAAMLPSRSGDWLQPPAMTTHTLRPGAMELLAAIRSSRSEMGATRQELRAKGRSQGLEGLLEYLAHEGYVYTTCDQDHFKCTDA